MRRQRVAEAIPHYRVWLDANPSNASGWSTLGRALFSVGRAGEAADAFRRALGIDPTYTPAREGLRAMGIGK